MFSSRLDLERGDLIEIMHRVWRRAAEGEEQIERWFVAEIHRLRAGHAAARQDWRMVN